MCGIAGIINFKNEKVPVEVLRNMMAQIRYRGPDECGMYLNNQVGIGSVRLSIIDISTGQQPMCNNDKSLWIVYNGEVFNYIELRRELQREGIHFKTDSDTEVILRYYEKYGSGCLKHFNGQFAFAIWNNHTKQLFMARDRMGIRPLFYTQQSDAFVFGSEIKVLLQSQKVQPKLSIQGLRQVFTFWTTINGSTCFEDIYEVPPGHFVTVTGNQVKLERFWSLNFPEADEACITNAEQAVDELHELFTDSVKLRLRADVPVAAYLSGGIDSSATTHYIQQVARQHLNTFSIGFADAEFDETPYQNEVASFLNTQHTGFTCQNREIAENFPEVVWHTEVPLLRTAPVPMYLLSKNVRRHNIKVVITGEGADEMLGGYNLFKEMYIRRFWARYPNSQYRPLLLKKLYPYIPSLQQQSGKMMKFFFGYKLNDTDNPFYSHLLRWNNTSKILGYLHPNITESLPDYDPLEDASRLIGNEFNRYSPLAKAQWLETRIFMSGYLLSSQGDRMAMANSVEGRYPFLDHRLVEYSTRLHPDLKMKGLNEKYILKKMMAGKIPESVLKRSKQAYRAPISRSFLGSHAPEYVREMLSRQQIEATGIFQYAQVEKLLKRLTDAPGSEIENMALAGILSTQLLHHRFIAQPLAPVADMSDCRILQV